jgi:hypothetical protein
MNTDKRNNNSLITRIPMADLANLCKMMILLEKTVVNGERARSRMGGHKRLRDCRMIEKIRLAGHRGAHFGP